MLVHAIGAAAWKIVPQHFALFLKICQYYTTQCAALKVLVLCSEIMKYVGLRPLYCIGKVKLCQNYIFFFQDREHFDCEVWIAKSATRDTAPGNRLLRNNVVFDFFQPCSEGALANGTSTTMKYNFV